MKLKKNDKPKACPKCRKKYSDRHLTCGRCGTPLVEKHEVEERVE